MMTDGNIAMDDTPYIGRQAASRETLIDQAQSSISVKKQALSRIESNRKRLTAPEIPGRLPLSDIGSMMESN
jgi:hypothetical protein